MVSLLPLGIHWDFDGRIIFGFSDPSS